MQGESNSGSPSSPDENIETVPIAPKTHIHSKPKNWYSNLCNRWFSLFGVNKFTCVKSNLIISTNLYYLQAALKIFMMFLVNWVYAIVCISAVFLVWLYIGTANPAVKPGLASEFRFFKWLKTVILRCMG